MTTLSDDDGSVGLLRSEDLDVLGSAAEGEGEKE